MVGDRKEDLIGALNCNLDAAGVLYGYGSKEELQEYSPVFYANSCNELVEWLLHTENTTI